MERRIDMFYCLEEKGMKKKTLMSIGFLMVDDKKTITDRIKFVLLYSGSSQDKSSKRL